MRGLLVCCALLLADLPARAVVDDGAATLLNELVTAALAREPRYDVVASADVRRQLELEGERQVLGCGTETSCLAEVAGALGAGLVVYGTIGQLDDLIVLTLNLYDSNAGQAVGRVVIRDVALRKIAERVDPAVQELVASHVAAHLQGPRVKLLVLDLARANSAPVGLAPEADAEVDGFLWGGIGALTAGALVVVGGGVLFATADGLDKELDADPSVDAVTAKERYGLRDSLGGASAAAFIVGGLASLIGGGLVTAAVTK